MWNALNSQGPVFYWQKLLSFFNVIFVMCGILTIAVGYHMQVSLQKFGLPLSAELLSALPLLLMTAGYVIIIIGCCASVCMNKPSLLITYGCCLTGLFILEVLITILIVAFRENIYLTFGRNLNVSMALYSENVRQQNQMDRTQIQFECCGYFGPGDWYNTPLHQIPPSCCKGRFCDPTKIAEIYSEGCMDKIHTFLSCNLRTVLTVILLSGCLPLVGAFFSFCLSYQIFLVKYQPVQIPSTEQIHYN